MTDVLSPTPPPPAARILLLSRGGELDGAQRQLCYLAAGLDRSRFEPLVFLDTAGPTQAELQRLNVKTHIAPMRDWRRFPEALFRYADARRLKRRAHHARVALVHASDLWKSPYALFIARHLKIPAVLHMRGPLRPRDIVKHRLRKAQAVIAISQHFHEDLLQAGLRRVHCIDDAVDMARFKPDAAARDAFRQSRGLGQHLAVGLVGRIEPFKRILEFLEVVGHLSPGARQQAIFFIIGQPGPPLYVQQVTQAIAQKQLQDRVVLTGRLDGLSQVLPALDLLVTLSGGSVCLEAMACGITVMNVRSNPRPPVHTRHGQTAWCQTTSNLREVAAGLEQLLADVPLRTRLAMGGMEWIRAQCAVSVLVEKTQAVYQSLLPNPQAPPSFVK